MGATIGRFEHMYMQRCCALCGETFEIVRKAGRPRRYCPICSPVGWQVVKVPGQSRTKLRRRPSLRSRPPVRSTPLRLVREEDPASVAMFAGLEREAAAYVDFLARLADSD
jgi:hypothetical protein